MGAHSFADAVQQAAPAVVNIYTRSLQRSRFETETSLRPQGLGSGVIMSKNGYVLTNSHVIANADQIIVALQDGRVFYDARLIGVDAFTDLAVLFIEADDLPVIPQNPAITPRVGDIVLAIGNPYNVGQTITQGIISATGRASLASTSYQDFLQTDAAINRGNSGGALINARGELIGINTAAFQTNAEQDIYGISFSVPYHLADKVMRGLIQDGRVFRGYLGINATSVDPVVAQQLRLGNSEAVAVSQLDPNGPAEAAGLEVNDIIVAIDKLPIESVPAAMTHIAETRPGSPLLLTVFRNGEVIEIELVVGEPPPPSS